MNKKPINVNAIRERNSNNDDVSLSDACLDYMGIEYNNSENEFEEKSKKHVQQQLRSGEAMVVKLTNVEFDDDDENKILVEAAIDYRKFPYENPGDVLSALRLKEPSGTTSGSFVRAIPLNRKLEPEEDIRGHQLYKYPSLTIDAINIDHGNNSGAGGEKPMTGVVKLSGLNMPSKQTEYVPGKRKLEIARGKDAHELSEGDVYLLMKSVGDYTSQSASYALKNPEYSDTAALVEDVINGTDSNSSSMFSEHRVDTFINWMRDSSSDVLPLNEKQVEFTRDVTNEISLLQGPPGTGKTSGATAPAIVSRLLAHENGSCRTLVTGASNKAINEVFEKTVELVDAYDTDPNTSDELSNVMFLRVSEPPEDYGNTVDPAEYSSRIAYTALYGNEAEEKHISTIRSRLRTRLAGDDDRHIVVFATPRRTWRVGKKVIPEFSLTESETIDGRVPEAKRRQDDMSLYSLFDVLVADEASMMNLPQFLLTGTFYQRGGNMLLSGDHRQLPPVRKHDWSSDFKPSITSLAPHLSVLDFFRLLGGEELQSIDDEKQKLLRVTESSTSANIPLHQLERTYRCHERVARFLNDWVYEKLDGLEYTSKETRTLSSVSSFTDGVNASMRPEKPVVVITYDDTTHQQSNPLESKIATSLLRVVSQETTTGVVTPHNAQRGLLETDMQLQSNVLDSTPDIDTVERFQGGERDFIIVSATVSDPDYIAAESEFLLNLNRLNVAMSRMKKKVIVIASESVFDHIPIDVDEYNDSLLWKGLAEESGISSVSPENIWSGSITEFTGLDKTEFDGDTENTTVNVHYL